LLPIFQSLADAISRFPDVDVVVNFSSFRSVFESTVDVLSHRQIRTVAIIAEGVPERQTRLLIQEARNKGVTIIGPATVGGIKPGCFRIGNTGGMLDNIIASRLYRPGSVAYVARSGGMSNELNNIISLNSDGVYEGIAIGGDKYPGTTFVDHLLRYQDNPEVKVGPQLHSHAHYTHHPPRSQLTSLPSSRWCRCVQIMVVLGEVGGVEEYDICKLIDDGRLNKPIVGWCIGTCAKIFPYEVQFGHAGACATGNLETADAKNLALKGRGVFVPAANRRLNTSLSTTPNSSNDAGTNTPRPLSARFLASAVSRLPVAQAPAWPNCTS
jgi:ATP citrate (pro-S)-lyase